jgi:hypothetical protein
VITRRRRRPAIVWVPVGTNVALVALAAVLSDATAVALTAVGAVVVTGAVVVFLREWDLDKERIAHLQSAVPVFTTPLDPDAAVNLVPRPSPIVAEVLRQMRPVVTPDAVSQVAIPPSVPIDRT